jgi:hypothetical protein
MRMTTSRLAAAFLVLSATFVEAKGQEGAAPQFTPGPTSPIATGPMSGRPVLADLDGDLDLDLALACGTCCGSEPHPDSGRVKVFLNDGRGGFRVADEDGVAVGPSVRKVAVGDLDGDGRPDLVACEHDSYLVTTLRNVGKGRFVPFPTSPFDAATGEHPHTHELLLADLDADGRLDVVTSNADDNSLSVLLGDGKGGFAPAEGSPFATPWRHPYDGLAAGDLDRDGKLDVVVPLLRDGRIAVLRGDGKGRLSASRELVTQVLARPGYVVLADVDRDGDLDALTTHDDVGDVSVLVNDGEGRLLQPKGPPLAFEGSLWGIASGDLDGDGILDLAFGTANGDQLVLARGDGRGEFTEFARLGTGRLANYPAIGDLDGDGLADLVVSCYGSGEVHVMLARPRRRD